MCVPLANKHLSMSLSSRNSKIVGHGWTRPAQTKGGLGMSQLWIFLTDRFGRMFGPKMTD